MKDLSKNQLAKSAISQQNENAEEIASFPTPTSRRPATETPNENGRQVGAPNERNAVESAVRVSPSSRRRVSIRSISSEIVFEPSPRENLGDFRFSLRDLQNSAADRAACELAFLKPKRARRDFWNLPAQRAAQSQNRRHNDFDDFSDRFGSEVA